MSPRIVVSIMRIRMIVLFWTFEGRHRFSTLCFESNNGSITDAIMSIWVGASAVCLHVFIIRMEGACLQVVV